jgi:hypothetical protein
MSGKSISHHTHLHKVNQQECTLKAVVMEPWTLILASTAFSTIYQPEWSIQKYSAEIYKHML